MNRALLRLTLPPGSSRAAVSIPPASRRDKSRMFPTHAVEPIPSHDRRFEQFSLGVVTGQFPNLCSRLPTEVFIEVSWTSEVMGNHRKQRCFQAIGFSKCLCSGVFFHQMRLAATPKTRDWSRRRSNVLARLRSTGCGCCAFYIEHCPLPLACHQF